MNILLYGGSFDPPHLGHTELLKNAIEKVKPSIALVVPAFQSILKDKHATDRRHRFWMSRIAFGDLPVEVSSMEIDRGAKIYTYEALRQIRETNPDAKIFALMGRDVYMQLPKFRNSLEVISSCTIVTGARGDDSKIDPLPNANPVIWVQDRGLNISSSEIRRKVFAGEDIRDLVHPTVQKYIETWRLYREPDPKENP